MQEDRNRRFEKLVMPHLDAVYRAAVALCGQSQQAEDLAQTTMVKALKTLATFAEGTHCKAWLLRILRNTWIDVLRRGRNVPGALPLDEALVAAPDPAGETKWSNPSDLLENFSDGQILQALAELPDDQRLTVYLLDVEQLNHRDVAEIMGVPPGTIKSRASRARAILRQRLESRARDLGFAGRMRHDTPER